MQNKNNIASWHKEDYKNEKEENLQSKCLENRKGTQGCQDSRNKKLQEILKKD